MTLPPERTRAVLSTRRFLLNLCDSKVTPGLKKSIREEARYLLKHYPSNSDLELAALMAENPLANFMSNFPFAKPSEMDKW